MTTACAAAYSRGVSRMGRSIASALMSREFPRLCRGGRRSLTFSGVHRDFSFCKPPSTPRVKSRWTSFESLSHSKWECKYHVVFIPNFRRKVLYGELRKHLGEVFRKLAEQRESRVEEGHLMPDHESVTLKAEPNRPPHPRPPARLHARRPIAPGVEPEGAQGVTQSGRRRSGRKRGAEG